MPVCPIQFGRQLPTRRLKTRGTVQSKFNRAQYSKAEVGVNTGVPLLYYQNPLFVTTKTVNMLLTVCQGGHHRPVVVNKVLTTVKCVNSKRRSVALC